MSQLTYLKQDSHLHMISSSDGLILFELSVGEDRKDFNTTPSNLRSSIFMMTDVRFAAGLGFVAVFKLSLASSTKITSSSSVSVVVVVDRSLCKKRWISGGDCDAVDDGDVGEEYEADDSGGDNG